MFVWWYLVLIGCLFVGIIYCSDSNPLSMEMDQEEIEPEVKVRLSVHSEMKPLTDIVVTDSPDNKISGPFACYECTNCNLKSNLIARNCDPGVTMCYIIHKRINNTNRVIQRGCSTSKERCSIPDKNQLNPFDSITCCTNYKCNQGIQFKPLFFLLILNIFIIINI